MAAKDVVHLLGDLRRNGYTTKHVGGGRQLLDAHGNTVRMPDGMPLIIHSTPSDRRWRQNMDAKLREAGVILNGENGSEAKQEVVSVFDLDPSKRPQAYTAAEKEAWNLRATALRKRLSLLGLDVRGAKAALIREGLKEAKLRGLQVFRDSTDKRNHSEVTYGSFMLGQFLKGFRQSGWMLDIYELGATAVEALNREAATEPVGEVNTMSPKYKRTRARGVERPQARATAQLVDRIRYWQRQRNLSDDNARAILTGKAIEVAKRDDRRIWPGDRESPMNLGIRTLRYVMDGSQPSMNTWKLSLFSDALHELEAFEVPVEAATVQVVEPELDLVLEEAYQAENHAGLDTMMRAAIAMARGGMDEAEAIMLAKRLAG